MKEENLVFLISQPRSGSTLTQKILGSHEKIYTRSEPWLMLHPAYSLKNEGMYAEYDCTVERIALDSFIADLPNGQKTYIDELKNMYLRLYSSYISNTEFEYFLDKTPRYYLILDELIKIYPNAKYILLIRNPLAVLGSIVDTWTKDNWFNLSNHKYDLTTALDVYMDALSNEYKNIHIVHYEKIISDSESEIKKIFEYLGLRFDSSVLNYNAAAGEKWEYGDQVNVYENNSIISGNDIKWHKKLNNPQYWRVMYDYINYIGGDVYQKLGYDYEQDLLLLKESIPGKTLEDVLSRTFSLFSFTDDTRDCLIENQQRKGIIDENIKELQSKNQDIILLNENINNQQEEIKKYETEIKEIKSAFEDNVNEFSAFKEKHIVQEAKAENMKQELLEKERDLSCLSNEKESMKQELLEKERDLSCLSNEKESMKQELLEKERDLSCLSNEKESMKQELQEKGRDLSCLSNEKESMIKTLAFYKNEAVQKNKIIDNLQDQIRNHVNHSNVLIQDKHAAVHQIVNTTTFKVGKIVVAPGHYSKRLYKWLFDKKYSLYDPPIEKNIEMDLGDQIAQYFGSHRSGWSFAVSCLAPLHAGSGVYLDTFIERTFVWKPGNIEPTLRPWIGFIHVPPNVPEWFQSQQSNKTIFETEQWKMSLPYCKGLFTLSDYHRKVLEMQLDVPISSVMHPTDLNVNQWTTEAFDRNNTKRIVQVGWWLRKLHAIYELPESGYTKTFLRVTNDAYLAELIDKEREIHIQQGLFKDEMYDTAEVIEYLPDDEYDRLLTENIVFLDLYDSSANNAIIECMARCTPILINPLEPVVEYLGVDYPFYYSNYDEAIEKASNHDLVVKTHNYLKLLETTKRLTCKQFVSDILSSEVVALL